MYQLVSRSKLLALPTSLFLRKLKKYDLYVLKKFNKINFKLENKTPIGVFSKKEQIRRNSLMTASSGQKNGRKSVCQGLMDTDNIDMEALRKKHNERSKLT